MSARDPLRRAIRQFHAAGKRVRRYGQRVLLDTTSDSETVEPDGAADTPLAAAHQEALERLVVPAVTKEQAEQVKVVLAAAGATVAYVTDPKEAASEVLVLQDK